MKTVSFDSYKYMIVTENTGRIILDNDLFELYELDISDRSERLILNSEDLEKSISNGMVLGIGVGF